ncbi:MAG: DUF1566 domain-containing protein, partial [Lentisphaeria bacterium]|nr:DUF1566 domain-containing protein [Lentisphaeria bacterium]
MHSMSRSLDLACWLLCSLMLLPLFSGCGTDGNPNQQEDPCLDQDCSGHGQCAVLGGDTAVCVCETGFYAVELTCVSDIPDACAGVDCNEGGVCTVSQGEALCLCGEGYHAEGPTHCVANAGCEGDCPLITVSAVVADACSDWRPVLHDELSYLTPQAVRAGVLSVALLREHQDPAPVELLSQSGLVELDLSAGGSLVETTNVQVPAGSYQYIRIDVAHAEVVVAATAHQGGFDIPGTFSLDVAGSRYSDAEGAHAQGDVLATFESMGFSNSYTSNTAFNCLLSWNGGSVDTTDGHFFVTVPIPNRPLLIDPASSEPIDIALRFPLTQSFAWQDLQNANFTEGVFDVSSIPSASELPSRLPICDFFMADRCADDAMPERVAPAFPMPDSSSVYCSDGTSTLSPCPAPGEPAFGQDGNYADPPAYTVDTDTVVDAGTQLVWQRGLADEQLDWWHARDYCATLELGGRTDWTLPSRNELISIIDAGRQTPSIDPDAFPNSPPGFFWTASPVPFLSLAYGIRFDQGYVYDHDPINQCYVRCVTQVPAPVLPRYRVVGSLVEDLATGLFWQQTM